MHHPLWRVRASFDRLRTDVQRSVLDSLAVDPRAEVRTIAARSATTPIEQLEVLADDEDHRVARMAVVRRDEERSCRVALDAPRQRRSSTVRIAIGAVTAVAAVIVRTVGDRNDSSDRRAPADRCTAIVAAPDTMPGDRGHIVTAGVSGRAIRLDADRVTVRLNVTGTVDIALGWTAQPESLSPMTFTSDHYESVCEVIAPRRFIDVVASDPLAPDGYRSLRLYPEDP